MLDVKILTHMACHILIVFILIFLTTIKAYSNNIKEIVNPNNYLTVAALSASEYTVPTSIEGFFSEAEENQALAQRIVNSFSKSGYFQNNGIFDINIYFRIFGEFYIDSIKRLEKNDRLGIIKVVWFSTFFVIYKAKTDIPYEEFKKYKKIGDDILKKLMKVMRIEYNGKNFNILISCTDDVFKKVDLPYSNKQNLTVEVMANTLKIVSNTLKSLNNHENYKEQYIKMLKTDEDIIAYEKGVKANWDEVIDVMKKYSSEQEVKEAIRNKEQWLKSGIHEEARLLIDSGKSVREAYKDCLVQTIKKMISLHKDILKKNFKPITDKEYTALLKKSKELKYADSRLNNIFKEYKLYISQLEDKEDAKRRLDDHINWIKYRRDEKAFIYITENYSKGDAYALSTSDYIDDELIPKKNEIEEIIKKQKFDANGRGPIIRGFYIGMTKNECINNAKKLGLIYKKINNVEFFTTERIFNEFKKSGLPIFLNEVHPLLDKWGNIVSLPTVSLIGIASDNGNNIIGIGFYGLGYIFNARDTGNHFLSSFMDRYNIGELHQDYCKGNHCCLSYTNTSEGWKILFYVSDKSKVLYIEIVSIQKTEDFTF